MEKVETQKKCNFQFRWRGRSVDILDMCDIVGHLGLQPLLETRNSQKWTPFSLSLKIETCNKNQAPLSLGQSTTPTCCQLSWMAAINRNVYFYTSNILMFNSFNGVFPKYILYNFIKFVVHLFETLNNLSVKVEVSILKTVLTTPQMLATTTMTADQSWLYSYTLTFIKWTKN